MNWFIRYWPETTLPLFFITSILIYFFGSQTIYFYLWIHIPLYLLHQFEEHKWPGRFIVHLNMYILGSDQPYFPLAKRGFFAFIINVGIVYLLFPLGISLSILTHNPLYGLWIPYMALVNGLAGHIIPFIRSKKWNDGVLASLLFQVPVGIYSIYQFGYLPLSSHIVSFLCGGVGLHVAMGISGLLIKNKKLNKIPLAVLGVSLVFGVTSYLIVLFMK